MTLNFYFQSLDPPHHLPHITSPPAEMYFVTGSVQDFSQNGIVNTIVKGFMGGANDAAAQQPQQQAAGSWQLSQQQTSGSWQQNPHSGGGFSAATSGGSSFQSSSSSPSFSTSSSSGGQSGNTGGQSSNSGGWTGFRGPANKG